MRLHLADIATRDPETTMREALQAGQEITIVLTNVEARRHFPDSRGVPSHDVWWQIASRIEVVNEVGTVVACLKSRAGDTFDQRG